MNPDDNFFDVEIIEKKYCDKCRTVHQTGNNECMWWRLWTELFKDHDEIVPIV